MLADSSNIFNKLMEIYRIQGKIARLLHEKRDRILQIAFSCLYYDPVTIGWAA